MKKVVLGFVLGIITSMAFTAFAVNSDVFTAQKAAFEVYVEGEKFESENPPLVVEGRTYLPLKTTGEVLGVEVNWNEAQRRVEIEKADNENEETTEMPKQTRETKQTETTNEIPKSGEVFIEFEQILGATYMKEIDGEQYVSPTAIGQEYIRNEDDSWYIALPGKEPVLVKMGSEPTEHSIKDVNRRILIKLSSLGLEAEINGNMIILKYK